MHDRIDHKLKEIEEEHGIPIRWSDDCPEYIFTKAIINSKEKQKLKLKRCETLPKKGGIY